MTENAWDRLRNRNLEFLTENNQNGGVWQEELNTVLADLNAMGEQTDTGEMLDIVQRANRLTLLIMTEQQNNADLKEQIERFTPNTWAQIEGAPASRKQQQKVGDQLMSGISLQEGDRLAMEATPEGKVIVEHIFNTCIEKRIPFDVTMPDHAFGRLLINACTPEQAYIYGREKWAVFDRDPEAKYLAVRREYASDVESVIDKDTIATKVDAVGRAKNEARKSHKETY